MEFQLEMANANYPKPANGHSWSEMECTSGLCVTADNKVGIGTDSPVEKLVVSGNARATDVCTDAGCLNSLFQIVNTTVNQELYNHSTTQRHIINCNAVGNPYNVSGTTICQIVGTACPSGWTAYGWNSTASATCGSSCYGFHTTGSHAFGPAQIESTPYTYGNVCSCSTGCFTATGTCYATVTSVGCY